MRAPLQIGGLSIALRESGSGADDSATGRGSALGATMMLDASRVPRIERPEAPPIIETPMWSAHTRDGGGLTFVVKIPTWSPAEVIRADVDADANRGVLQVRGDVPGDPLGYPLDQLLTVYLLEQRGGLLIHGACIADEHGAAVVAGRSGAGKTTFSRAAAAIGARVLTDERVVLEPTAEGWVAHGTPWFGEGCFAELATAKLRALYLVEHSDRDAIVPLSPARALAELAGCHISPAWKGNLASHLEPLERLLAEVPIFALRQSLDGDAPRRVLAHSHTCRGS